MLQFCRGVGGRVKSFRCKSVLYLCVHRISGNIVIVAKLAIKPITFIIEFSNNYDIATYTMKIDVQTRKSCTGQVLPSAKYRPMCLVVDAALRRIGKSRHGDHKIANISLNCRRI